MKNKINITIMDQLNDLINYDDFNELYELIEEGWDDSEEVTPSIYFGIYNNGQNNNYLLLTIKDDSNIYKFMNSYGDILITPKVLSKKYRDINIYLIEDEPIISHFVLNDHTEKFVYNNFLNDLQTTINGKLF